MIQIFKYNLGFYIKSNIDKPINIIAEQLDIETNEYINPKVIASLLPFSGIDYSFTTDGKYRISYSINILGNPNSIIDTSKPIIDISYLYIESYSIFLNQVISNVKDFLCTSGSCCESKGSDIESANYATNLLLNYYNLATNTTFNNNECCNPLDSFIRNLSDFLRLDILSDLNSSSKNDCLSNTKVSIPTLKKLSSVYFLAIYLGDFHNQFKDENYKQNLEKLKEIYSIESIQKCITKQGINIDKAKELFLESLSISNTIESKDKSFILSPNIQEENYKLVIKPSDLFTNPESLEVFINIVTLPILGKLYYSDKGGRIVEVTSTGFLPFKESVNTNLTYIYDKVSTSNTDVFLYSISNSNTDCLDGKTRTVTIKLNEYGFNEDTEVLNLVVVKTPVNNSTSFNYFHLFKLFNNPIILYNIKEVKFYLDNSYIILEDYLGNPLETTQPIINFDNKVFFRKGVLLDIKAPYKGGIEVIFNDNKSIKTSILFRLAENSEFDNIVPVFTVNSVHESVNTLEFPFYNKEFVMYADAISEHKEEVAFYFKANSGDIEPLGLNSVKIVNKFPRTYNVGITASTNKNGYNKNYIIDNTKADVKLLINSLEAYNYTVSFDEDNLGEGKIINAAWDYGVINKEPLHTYTTLDNKEIYLEVYPHDRFRFNSPYLTDINLIGTFKRIDISETNVERSKVNILLKDLEQRTTADNKDKLPIGLFSFNNYFIAKSLRTDYSVFPSQVLYDKMYAKGILVNVAKSTYTNPMPTDLNNIDKLYPDFEVVLSSVEKVSNFCELDTKIVTSETNLADVPIYARLEAMTINGWKTFNTEYFYHTLKLTNTAKESVSIAGLKTDNQGFATFRIIYQGPIGTKVSNELKVKPLSFIEESNISSINSIREGLLVYLTNKVVNGDTLNLIVTTDSFGEHFIQSVEFLKSAGASSLEIPLTFLNQEIINKSTFYISVIKNGVLQEIVPIDNIDNRVSIIPEASLGNSVANSYQFNINRFLGQGLTIFSNTTYSPNYGIIPDYPDKEVYKITDVYTSTDGVSFTKQASNTGDYVNLPLEEFTNISKFYLKTISYIVQDTNTNGNIIYKTLESYTITIALTQ